MTNTFSLTPQCQLFILYFSGFLSYPLTVLNTHLVLNIRFNEQCNGQDPTAMGSSARVCKVDFLTNTGTSMNPMSSVGHLNLESGSSPSPSCVYQRWHPSTHIPQRLQKIKNTVALHDPLKMFGINWHFLLLTKKSPVRDCVVPCPWNFQNFPLSWNVLLWSHTSKKVSFIFHLSLSDEKSSSWL